MKKNNSADLGAMRAAIRLRLALRAVSRPKPAPRVPRRFSPPKAPLRPFIDIAQAMTVARIAKMLTCPVGEARMEQVRFLRFVEDNAVLTPQWAHELDAWLDFQTYEHHVARCAMPLTKPISLPVSTP